VDLGPCHIVLDGDPAPLPKRGRSPPPQFSAHFYCGQTVGCIKMLLGTEVGLSPGDFVLDGDPVPSPKRGRNPQFSAHVYCGQTAGWIKMALGVEVDLVLATLCLMGTQLPPPKKRGGAPPIFGPSLLSLLWPNGCKYQDTTWYGGRPQLGDIALDGDPAPPRKGHSSLPLFSALSIVATVAHLSYC